MAAVIAIQVIGGAAGVAASPSYRYLGSRAPSVKPNPIVEQLQQRLQVLQEQWKARSIRTTLESAIEQSLLNNPDLAQAYAQIQQRQWTLISIRRQWYPSLSASAAGPAGGLWGYGGSTTTSTSSTTAGTTNQTSYENRSRFAPSLTVGWTFFDPSRSPQINAASESLRSQQLLFDVTARNQVLQTQLAYFNLQEQKQLITAYEEILNATAKQVKQTEALFNAGNASIADVEQIRTQQYQTLSLLIGTYAGVIDAAASLARAMALAPGQLVLPEGGLETYGQWDLPLGATIRQAQSLREEIQASLAQGNSANWSANALFNRYWPRFSLAANGTAAQFNSSSGIPGTGTPNTLQSSTLDGAIGLGFNWSMFDGGINAAQAEVEKARARQLRDQAATQRLQISEEVEQSYASYEVSRLTLISTREQAESAQRAAIAIRERFNVGYADTTSVVQTLNQAISAANLYARSQREYNSAVARLYRSSAQWPQRTQTWKDQRARALKDR